MPHRQRLGFWFCFGAVTFAGLTGCVERRMVIAEPVGSYGAMVFDEKNHPIGQTPVDRQFTFYGTYRYRLVKDGYKTLVVEENVKAPWYEWFGLDFFSENLLPFTLRDRRTFTYTMQPLEIVPPETLMQQAEALRAYGLTKGTPLPESAVPTSPPVLMPPATDVRPALPPNANPPVVPVPAASNPPVVAPPNANPSVVPVPPANNPPLLPPNANPSVVPVPPANSPPVVPEPPAAP